jgi:histidinol-phosphate aminotransferase
MRARWREQLSRITPYEPGPPIEALEAALGRRIIRLSANESPLGPSPLAIEAIKAEASRVHLYPDGGADRLRHALAEKLGVDQSAVILGNGADELIGFFSLAALEPEDEVIIPHPSFEPYETATALMGATAIRSPLREYQIDLDDCLRRLTPRTKALFLCNPHNPTGTIFTRDQWAAFLSQLDDPPFIILDEAYRDFADDPQCPDGLLDLPRCPTLIVVRTFSKIAGLAGLRIGYAIARPETIEALNRVRAPYNINRLAQVAALAALGDKAHWERTRALIWQEKNFLTQEITRRGWRVVPTQANFLLVEIGEKSEALRTRCRKAGILVRDGSAVGYPGHLRITLGDRAQNGALLAALSEP